MVLNVCREFRVGLSEVLLDGIDDSEISLMDYVPVYLILGQRKFIQQLLDVLCRSLDGEPEDFATVHLKAAVGVVSLEIWGRHEASLLPDLVGIQLAAELYALDVVARSQNRGTCSISEKDAGGPVVPVTHP